MDTLNHTQNVSFIFFYVPCLSQALAIMALHTARSCVVCSSSVVLLPHHVERLSIIFILWRPLDLFPSIFPVVTICSNFFFLMTWPINRACCVLTLLMIFLFDLAALRMTSLLCFAVRGTRSILLKNHISVASIVFCELLVIVQDSHPYINLGSM